MGKLIGTLFTLGIGILIGMSLPKDSLQKIELPNLSSFKTVSEKDDDVTEESVAVVTPTKEAVKVAKAVPPAPVVEESAAVLPSQSGLYTVQVASFSKRRDAENYVNRMNDDQIDAYIAPGDLTQNKSTFRVFVGEYTSRQDALAKQQALAKHFQGAFVQHF